MLMESSSRKDSVVQTCLGLAPGKAGELENPAAHLCGREVTWKRRNKNAVCLSPLFISPMEETVQAVIASFRSVSVLELYQFMLSLLTL